MKRHNSDGPMADSKRSRGGDSYNDALAEGKFEFRFLLPTKCAGPVIGKGGETIKALRQKFDNALINIPDRQTPERVCTITVARDRVAECFAEVLDKVADVSGVEEASRLLECQTKKEEIELRVLIYQGHAGAVIGRGGSKIKELREQTGAHLKVYKECCPQSTDRVLQITGAKEKLPDVVKVVTDFIAGVEVKGSQRPYDTINYDPRMVYEYGGYASDKPFHAQGPPPNASYNQPPVWSTGPNSMYGNQGGSSGPVYVDSAVITTQVTIPNELAGTIIGRGGTIVVNRASIMTLCLGERINSIRQEASARIDIGSAIGNERIITIQGTQQQIQAAQYLLQQTVRQSDAGRRYLSSSHH
ncbi:hypothetical protein M3Y98_00515300 [Aphelenchoides besseyi]|nr:hypothetical protein M3Y98_00515300 [Aphelenchoides besseyi]KAI6207892.1 hypothetical protein M3Y96_00057100 [Aphelenchoides besseyi]